MNCKVVSGNACPHPGPLPREREKNWRTAVQRFCGAVAELWPPPSGGGEGAKEARIARTGGLRVIGDAEDRAKVVGRMAPFRSEPGCRLKSSQRMMQPMLKAAATGRLVARRGRGAPCYGWSCRGQAGPGAGASWIVQGHGAAAEGIHQAIVGGLVGLPSWMVKLAAHFVARYRPQKLVGFSGRC